MVINMNKRKIENRNILMLRKYMTIVFGTFLMAMSVNFIYEPMAMVTGGFSGLGIIIKHWTRSLIGGGLPIWMFTILCNAPLFLISAKVIGRRFAISSLFGTVSFIIALMIVPVYDFQFDDYLMAAICGGVIDGIGIGLIFSVQASTGGTDLLASLIHHYKRHVSIPQILIIVDSIVVFAGAVVFGLGNALYATISIFIITKVSDGILEGLKFAKMAYIISDNYAEIADAILVKMDRGVTGLSATGMYSNRDKKMLFCVVSKKEIVQIVEISKKIDPNSFVIVSDVREVMGEGFIEYRQ
ncbi:MAG: YitT family protein [Mobilitalea sp.]